MKMGHGEQTTWKKKSLHKGARGSTQTERGEGNIYRDLYKDVHTQRKKRFTRGAGRAKSQSFIEQMKLSFPFNSIEIFHDLFELSGPKDRRVSGPFIWRAKKKKKRKKNSRLFIESWLFYF